jgi:hypothetical protein
MLARVLSAPVNGIEAFPVELEVNSGWGDTVIFTIGPPDEAHNNLRSDIALRPL